MPHGKILLIMGSVRAGRNCPIITEWIQSVGNKAVSEFLFEIVDLANWCLPMDDEPHIPATGEYIQSHTRAWSEKIQSADGVIFITPQFNWGYPAVLKNAIDHLYHEWCDKPVMFVTYGGHGGSKCAEQLKLVSTSLKMKVVEAQPQLTLPHAVIREGATLVPDEMFSGDEGVVKKGFEELANLFEQ